VNAQGCFSPTEVGRRYFRFRFFSISCRAPPIEEPMSELRRLKMKIGDAEFEAEVAEDEVYPMYDQFLSMLGERRPPPAQAGFVQTSRTASDQSLLTRIFDLRQDGTIVLKVLPDGPDSNTNAMLLLLYGYLLLKNEECVLATQLFRAAEQSGFSLRRPAKECVRNGRFVVRNGQRKGSNYALNNQGLAVAKEITAKILGRANRPRPAGALTGITGEMATPHSSR
jgi:hypothetical protein